MQKLNTLIQLLTLSVSFTTYAADPMLDFLLSEENISTSEKFKIDEDGYHGKYTFSLKKLHEIQQQYIGNAEINPKNFKEKFALEVHQKIYEAYPELVIPPGQAQWNFNSVGGEFTELYPIYCSPTEVLGLWGAPGRVVGAAGRYKKMQHLDFILTGQMDIWTSGIPFKVREKSYYRSYTNGGTDSISSEFPNQQYGVIIDNGMYEITYSRGNLLSSIRVGGKIGGKYVSGDQESGKALTRACMKMAMKNIFSKSKRKAIQHYRDTNPDYVK